MFNARSEAPAPNGRRATPQRVEPDDRSPTGAAASGIAGNFSILSLRDRRYVLLACLTAAVFAQPGMAAAQEANVIGPPALSDFELQPEGDAPAEPGPIIAPLERRPVQAEPAPPAAEPPVSIAPPPAPVPAPRRTAPERTETAETRRPSNPPPPAPQQSAPEPEATSTVPMAFEPAPETAVPAGSGDAAAERPTPQGTGRWWLYLLLGGALAAVGGVALARRRTARPALAGVPVSRPTASPPAPAATAPRPAPQSRARPRLEVDFRPSQAGANEAQAAVRFELMLRNVGDGEARNVRVESRLFNAGPQQDREISAFFEGRGPDGVASPVPIEPQRQIPYRSVVTLPRDQLREIRVNERRLFIPVVAFNVHYQWAEGGSAQTSACYLVGVESDPPAEKMGAFRLDLGPRIYRRVGQREHRLARRT